MELIGASPITLRVTNYSRVPAFQRGARLITGISGSRIEDVMPAVATSPTLAVNAGETGPFLEPLWHNNDLTSQGNAQHV